jgi:RNA polymerase sigma factor (sigma-70 family)
VAIGAVILGAPLLVASGGNEMNTASRDLHQDDLAESAILGRITAHHSDFLRFIATRVGEPAAAEDILQSAYLKALEHGSQLRDEESVVAWFYRILRNAIINHYRRGSARSKAHELFGAETPTSYEAELEQKICACIGDVIGDLKTEYREAIERVDLGGESVESFAQLQNTTANNASVRLHRARKAVAKKLGQICGVCAEHKCLDCTCRNRL